VSAAPAATVGTFPATVVTVAQADRRFSAFLAQGAPAATQWGCSAQAVTAAKVAQVA
jgi:hypothetical protein